MIECTITFNGGAVLHLKSSTPRDRELLRLASEGKKISLKFIDDGLDIVIHPKEEKSDTIG